MSESFQTTRWTLVRSAGEGDPATARTALEILCKSYWQPLYGFVRRNGFSREDAEDFTQGFLCSLMERKDFARLKQGQGRFRSFLLAALKNFLINARKRETAIKRGGQTLTFSLDWQLAETELEIKDRGQIPPDAAYDREWALALLKNVLEKVQTECHARGEGRRFEILKGFLEVRRTEISYEKVASMLEMDTGAARVAVHRLRKRYRTMLHEEIRQTLDDPGMVEEELQVLMNAFSERY